MNPIWQMYVDTGGTFTDALAVSPQGKLSRVKVLSSGALRGTVGKRLTSRKFEIAVSWRADVDVLRGGSCHFMMDGAKPVAVVSYQPRRGQLELDADPGVETPAGTVFEVRTGEMAPLLAARLLTGTPVGEPLPPVTMRLGTTLATNALLTRSGAPTVLFVTRGFQDLLEIGNQQRPHLFALRVVKPPLLTVATVEVEERITADGETLAAPALNELDAPIAKLLADGAVSAAVALLHSDRHPRHEQVVAAHLRRAGFAHVSCSSDLAHTIRILPRATTAVVDAYLAPVVSDYLSGIGRSLHDGRLLTMTSAGGLVGVGTARPKDLLLSGPAGGVVGAARAATRAGFDRVLSFDMGGTSTDVARYDGDYDYVFEHRVGDACLFAPALAIETVAAGGGSICRCDRDGLTVGPQSAGADPGPACYGAGGPLTLTDVNLLLGRLDPERFGIPVSSEPARRALDVLLATLREQTGDSPAAEDVLAGFLQIADERMADAIRHISTRRGYDPADYTLVTFGGAGGQHACAVADLLGVAALLVPADAGLLSAWGMAGAVMERFATRQLLAPLSEVADQVPAILADLANEARSELVREGVSPQDIVIRRHIAEMRFAGQETTLQVEADGSLPLRDAFARRYLAVYGHEATDRLAELVSLRVVASSRPPQDQGEEQSDTTYQPKPTGSRRSWCDGRWREVPVHDREDLAPGAACDGPALIFDRYSATVVKPGWHARLNTHGALLLHRRARPEATTSPGRPEAVQVELFSSRLEMIAREMGAVLERTAVSTNVKERHDFSCALLDAAGELVVNAPHIPVHLGSLGLCVRSVRDALPLAPGDMVVTNHPAYGGSHLPDLTVVAPVYTGQSEPGGQGELIGYAAARAHHAEIGGIRPGSMPPNARRLSEEGVVIPPTLIVHAGRFRLDSIRDVLLADRYPTRSVADNLADLRAAVAACHRGGRALAALAEAHGSDTVAHYMAALKDRAERSMRQALAAFPDREYTAQEFLDDGTPLAVRITITGDTAIVDFTGSATLHEGNLNATPAIVHSVVFYVLRLLIQDELPLNEGLLRPVRVVLPTGILNPSFPDDPTLAPSIVGGNVETSQRLVDLLLKALRLCAASQGTMNHVLFGDDRFSYYETVCGGCGAGPWFDGASGVHSHMTNTRITDPELLEVRYPVRLEKFALRCGSGGNGRHKGGDGVVRIYTFLAPLQLSILSQRRREGPYGLAGGEPGRPGAQKLVQANGREIRLAGIDSREVDAGDRLELETPGGGGYGTPLPAATTASIEPARRSGPGASS